MKSHWHADIKVSKLHFFMQLLAAVLYVLVALITLDIISDSPIMWAVGCSSLASSAYLIFATPTSHSASAWRLVGSYGIAICCGLIVRHVGLWMMQHNGIMLLSLTHDPHMYWFTGAISVGISMFLMLLFSLEHPPAAGMALVLVIEQRSYEAIVAIFSLVLLLAFIKLLIGRYLSDVT